MANPTDAREAFIHEVFGEILKLERSVKDTAAQVGGIVAELNRFETGISMSTKRLVDAANQIAISNSLTSRQAQEELKEAIVRIETGSVNLARSIQPLTDLTLGLREVARAEAKKHISDFLDRKEKKLDSMLITMDVFLQQIELASERLPQLSTPPYNVSQIKDGSIEHIKSGMSMRTIKRDIKNWLSKTMRR